MALSSSPGISTVQLVRTVGHTTTNHLIPALCTSSPQTLPMNNSCLTNAVHLNNVSVVSPVNVHINTRTSAPSPTALKLATVAASMDRVPKVTPSSAISSIARWVWGKLEHFEVRLCCINVSIDVPNSALERIGSAAETLLSVASASHTSSRWQLQCGCDKPQEWILWIYPQIICTDFRDQEFGESSSGFQMAPWF